MKCPACGKIVSPTIATTWYGKTEVVGFHFGSNKRKRKPCSGSGQKAKK